MATTTCRLSKNGLSLVLPILGTKRLYGAGKRQANRSLSRRWHSFAWIRACGSWAHNPRSNWIHRLSDSIVNALWCSGKERTRHGQLPLSSKARQFQSQTRLRHHWLYLQSHGTKAFPSEGYQASIPAESIPSQIPQIILQFRWWTASIGSRASV